MRLEKNNDIQVANISSLIWYSGYRLIRISDLEEADVIAGFSLPWEKTWSYIELNDGSWEIGIPLGHIDYFRYLIRTVSNAKIDLKYNPLFVPDHDVQYFGSFTAAHSMHEHWLKRRAERIFGTPQIFYNILVFFQRLICQNIGSHLG